MRFTLPISRLVRRFAARRQVRSPSVPALPALSRLPPELLCAIFRLLSTRSCVAVSHVSSRWRDTALSDPIVWASLDMAGLTKSHTVLQELLQRSGVLHVDLRRLHIRYLTAEAFGHVLLAHFHRLRTLEFDVRTAADFRTLCETVLSHTRAPLLETLSICKTINTGEYLEITGPLFDGCAPHLRRLTLDLVRVASAAYPAFASVTEFICINPPAVREAPQAMPEIFPHLRSFEMHTSSFWPYGRVLHTPSRVVYSSSCGDADLFLEATFPLGHQEIASLEINCPCSVDAVAEVLTPIDSTFSATISTPRAYSLDDLLITFDDGRARHFSTAVNGNSVLKALERVAQNCTALTCPAILLAGMPALPNLRDSTLR